MPAWVCQPLLGRVLTDEDDKPAASPAAVLSFRYWQQRFGGNPAVVGKQINLNNVAFTVIGVTPSGFDGTMGLGSTQDVTIPLALEPQLYVDRQPVESEWRRRLVAAIDGPVEARCNGRAGARSTGTCLSINLSSSIAARVRPQAQAAGGNAIKDLDPNQYPRLYLDPGGQGEMNTRRGFASSLYLLLGVVGLVLLIACANVANLLLSRAAARQKEIGLRLALGASRGRLIRQLLTESLLLSVLGGAIGILFAIWIKDGLMTVSDWGGRGMRCPGTTA